jgi:AraC-like DNA-binding protein
VIKLLEDPPVIHPPEEFARYACRCGGERKPRYDAGQDDVRCDRCRRWVQGFLPDPNPARTLMPLPRRERLTHEARARRRKRIAQCATLGVTLDELRDVFGVNEKMVRRVCAAAGVAPRNPGACGKTIRVLAALKAGGTVAEVAERLGVSRTRVYRINDEARLCGVLPWDGRDAP